MTYLIGLFYICQFYCRVVISGKCVHIWIYVDNW
jgi:hypothetical protein